MDSSTYSHTVQADYTSDVPRDDGPSCGRNPVLVRLLVRENSRMGISVCKKPSKARISRPRRAVVILYIALVDSVRTAWEWRSPRAPPHVDDRPCRRNPSRVRLLVRETSIVAGKKRKTISSEEPLKDPRRILLRRAGWRLWVQRNRRTQTHSVTCTRLSLQESGISSGWTCGLSTPMMLSLPGWVVRQILRANGLGLL